MSRRSPSLPRNTPPLKEIGADDKTRYKLQLLKPRIKHAQNRGFLSLPPHPPPKIRFFFFLNMEIKIIIRSTAYMDNPLRFSKRKEKLPCANQNVTGARTKIQLPIHIYMFKGLDNYKGLVKRLNKATQKYSPGCAGLAQIFEPS